MTRSLKKCLLVGGLLVAGGAHAQDTITCESQGNQRRTCSADTRGGVTLETQYSHSPCVEGQSWGHDRNNIWVSNGCRAEFRTGTAPRDHGSRGDTAAAIAAVALIGAAVMASRHHDESSPSSTPTTSHGSAQTPAYNACQQAVVSKVQAQRSGAERVQTSSEYEEYQASTAESGLRGDGQYQDRGGNWTDFRYECVFNVRNGQVTNVKTFF